MTSSLQFARGPQAVQVSAAPQATMIGPPPSAGPTGARLASIPERFSSCCACAPEPTFTACSACAAFGWEMRIPFSAFPESARVKLQEFDENNDERSLRPHQCSRPAPRVSWLTHSRFTRDSLLGRNTGVLTWDPLQHRCA